MDGVRAVWAGGWKGSTTSTAARDAAGGVAGAPGAGAGAAASLFGSTAAGKAVSTPTPTPEKFKSVPENPVMMGSVVEDLLAYWTWGRVREEVGVECGSAAAGGGDNELAFADLVEMVPNEADIYCAELARKETTAPVAVLTSDSDLLVHDLGEWGSVVFYDSLELVGFGLEGGRDKVVIKGMELHPAVIASRLGVVSIPRLAFEMKLDGGGGKKNDAVRRAKDSSGRVEGTASFKAFMEEYEPLPACAGRRAKSGIHIYNPRVAELVSQYDYPLLHKDSEPYHSYLPTLIEDTTRRSACVDGTDIRILAYSLLNITYPSTSRQTTIQEFSRRGPRITPSTLHLLTTPENIASELSSFLTTLQRIQSLLRADSEPLNFWTIFALYTVYATDTDIPSHKETVNFLTLGSVSPDRLSWDDVHRYARMIGVLYSVKMLREVLSVLTGKVSGDCDGLLGVVEEAKGWMETVPRGSELFCDKKERGKGFRGVGCWDVIGGLMELVREVREVREEADGDCEMESKTTEGWVVGGKGRKRGRASRAGEKGEKETQKRGKIGKGGNMFDILAGM